MSEFEFEDVINHVKKIMSAEKYIRVAAEALFKMQKEIGKWKALAGELMRECKIASAHCTTLQPGIKKGLDEVIAKAREAGL